MVTTQTTPAAPPLPTPGSFRAFLPYLHDHRLTLMLTDPEIILLDEPTSSVDSVTEQVLRETLDGLAANRTVLVVAHRLSTVADSDRIVVMDGGRVSAVKTHQELLEGGGLYRELATHQLLA